MSAAPNPYMLSGESRDDRDPVRNPTFRPKEESRPCTRKD